MRRTICYFLAVLLLVSLLSGCSAGAKQQQAAQSAQPQPAQAAETEEIELKALDTGRWFRAEFDELPGMDVLDSAQSVPGGAVLAGMRYTQDGAQAGYAVYAEDGSAQFTQLPLQEGGTLEYLLLWDETPVWLERVYEDEIDHQTLHIGDATADLRGYLTEGVSASWLVCVDTLALAFSSDGQILAFDEAAAPVWQIQTEVLFDEVLTGKQGDAIVLTQDGEFQRLDLSARALVPVCAAPELVLEAKLYAGAAWGYDFLVLGDYWLYGWNLGEAVVERQVNLDATGLLSRDFDALACLDEHTLIGSYWQYGESRYRLIMITEMDELPETATLTIAGITRASTITNAMADFSQTHPEYTVEYVDYEERYGDQALTRLAIDLQSENCPDLLVLGSMPFDAYCQQGLLENLYDYLDRGSGLAREDLLAPLVQALQQSEDALYRLPQSFSLAAVIGLHAATGAPEDWTWDTFYQAVDTLPDDCAVFYNHNPNEQLYDIVFHAFDSFVDYETRQAYFNTDTFVQLLTFLNDISNRPDAQSDDAIEALRRGEILLQSVTLSRAEQYEEFSAQLGEEISFIGFPGGSGASFYLTTPVAICTNAHEKDGAWAFIQTLLQGNYFSIRGGFSPVAEKLDRQLADALDAGCTQPSVDALRDLIYTATRVATYDEAVFAIVVDEAAPYFDGQCTAEQAAEKIQSRVELYLMEQEN